MQSENFLLLAITAERFGSRPSRLVGLDDAVLALDFDLAAAARLLERERNAAAEISADPAVTSQASPPRAHEEHW